MEWTSDNAGERYTATQGSCQGLVWRESAGEWSALISREGTALHTNRFTTLEEAWAWCEAQLADLAAGGQCAP